MMREIVVLTERDLRQVVELGPDAVNVVESAFRALATENVVMPPILSMTLPQANAEVDVKTAYIPGFDGFAIKVSPGFFDNPALGLASLNGLMVLFSSTTGLVDALLLDNGYLTDVRTAAAGAVAARHLARTDASALGVYGTGVQARLQAQAVALERPIERVLVWGRDLKKAQVCAADIARSLGVAASAEVNPDRVAAESDIVVTTTPSNSPIFKRSWLHAGLHVTAMGSDQEEKNEIESAALLAATRYVCDRVSQCELLGELRSALANGHWNGGRPVELGEVVVGNASARTSADDVTICDLTGTGVQDTAIASFALERALAAGIGARFST